MDITSKWFNYLITERKLSAEVIRAAGLDVAGDMLKIPVYDEAGNQLFSKFRKAPWDKTEGPKYQYEVGSSVQLYGIDHLSSNITIVEGELDVLAMLTCGFNACTSTGGALSFQEVWAPYFDGTNITILFDNDESGIKGAVRTAFILKKVTYRWVPPRFGKDVSDVLRDHGKEGVVAIMQHTENKVAVDIPDLSTKKSLIDYRRKLNEEVRKYTTGSIGAHFLRGIILELTLQINATNKAKREAMDANTPEIVRARSFPIANLIEVRRHTAICPFHTERTGSLHIYPDNHAFCFGSCRKRYDAIDIAMNKYGLTFSEAVKKLQ